MTAGGKDGRHGYSRSRILCAGSVENAHSHWNKGEGEEGSSSQDGGGSRKSLLLVMEQERGAKLEARRRRWDLINSSSSRLHSLKVNEGDAYYSLIISCF